MVLAMDEYIRQLKHERKIMIHHIENIIQNATRLISGKIDIKIDILENT